MTWTIHNVDCLDFLRTLPDGSVDAVVTDPPYAIPTCVASGRSNTRNVGDLSLIEATFRVLFTDFKRVLKPTGRLFVFCDGVSYPVVFRAAYGSFNTALLIWDKGRIGMGREFRKSHELVMHSWLPDTPVESDGTGYSDVLHVPPISSQEREHAAQKPVELLEQLLRVCGSTVLDPFAGSGTTGVACIQTGRNFIGCEIDAGYAEIARRRCREAEESVGLLAGVGK